MDVAAIAAQDQAEAREREFDRRAYPYVIGFLVAILLVSGYALLGLNCDVPLPSWSPAGNCANGLSPFAKTLLVILVGGWVVANAIWKAVDLTLDARSRGRSR